MTASIKLVVQNMLLNLTSEEILASALTERTEEISVFTVPNSLYHLSYAPQHKEFI